LSARFKAGVSLSAQDADEIRTAVANRDGLLRMYQKLLVEKEQRLRDFMQVKQDALARGGPTSSEIVLSSRTWRMIMGLHRLKYRLTVLRRRFWRQK